MNLSNFELLLLSVAVTAVMMLGTTNIRTNLDLYSCHTILIAACTAWISHIRREPELFIIAIVILVAKAWLVPWFLKNVIKRVGVATDSGTFVPTALSMHMGIALLGASYLLSQRIPSMLHEPYAATGAMISFSLISTGMMLMLTRRIAVNQVVGFLVIDNGIFMFSLSQTHGMPMSIELGILLDLLVAVMIAGLLLFRIKKSFAHIDVSQMKGLKD
ncbi:MAG: hypothetical protein K2Z81_13915 [Cyanobacteria bacterium]|nr:hypothetical protein [Cyanobacteriota bacterium]